MDSSEIPSWLSEMGEGMESSSMVMNEFEDWNDEAWDEEEIAMMQQDLEETCLLKSDENASSFAMAPPPPPAVIASETLAGGASRTLCFENGDRKGRTYTSENNARIRPPSQPYDHVLSEKKRRQRLRQRFLDLSAIVPGLQKMDKTSVLGGAIKYLKYLQERAKFLEEKVTNQNAESAVQVRKTHVTVTGDGEDEEEVSSVDSPLPEVIGRISDGHGLLAIHCEIQKGVLAKLVNQVENLNLNVTAFGSLALDITILAQVEEGFAATIEEVVRMLRSTLSSPATRWTFALSD